MPETFTGFSEVREVGEGAKLLHELERSGDFVFHGSDKPDIPELVPFQGTTWVDDVKQNDGPPAVATTPYADMAIFHALVRDDSHSFGQANDGTLQMSATQLALDSVKGRTAYVYVFPKSAFVPRHGNDHDFEWRSEVNQKPAQVVPVNDRDLPKSINILPPE